MSGLGSGLGSGSVSGSYASRVTLAVDGVGSFSQWTSVEVTRDLREISGSFHLQYVDDYAIASAAPVFTGEQPFLASIKAGMAFTLSIDGEVEMTGHIDEVEREWSATSYSARVTGRDKTADLVDCSAAPTGPAEYSNLDLLQLATLICKPFGITPRADIDIGAPFPRITLNPHETAFSLLEKQARQRATLLVSDGVGGLLLTRGGTSQAPAPLVRPGNIQGGKATYSLRRRYSDTYVKGQSDARARRHGIAAPLTTSSAPGNTAVTPPASATTTERSTIIMTGHAQDPEVTRYRPTVRMTRTQSGSASAQQQAEWMVRVARGESRNQTYTVLDWRAGPSNARWMPNQQVQVTDPYADIDTTMLIAGVTKGLTEQGAVTHLRVTGVSAYDLIDEPARRRQTKAHNSTSRHGLRRSQWTP